MSDLTSPSSTSSTKSNKMAKACEQLEDSKQQLSELIGLAKAQLKRKEVSEDEQDKLYSKLAKLEERRLAIESDSACTPNTKEELLDDVADTKRSTAKRIIVLKKERKKKDNNRSRVTAVSISFQTSRLQQLRSWFVPVHCHYCIIIISPSKHRTNIAQ